ncbi:SH3 domain-containing protein [Virgibacillus sp. FSP13]
MCNQYHKLRSLFRFIFILVLVTGSVTLLSPNAKVNAESYLNGVALKDPTNVYESTSTNSTVLKDYQKGTVLVYESYNSSWYSATVYVNGVRKNGFINKNDVETSVENQVLLQGVALNSPTVVYSDATTDSRNLKSYAKGSILFYQTFSTNWYEATVYIGGKRHTGYIQKSHVENAIQNQNEHRELALKNPTTVYSDASTNSSKLKSYDVGSKLLFRTFSSDWYQATVFVDGIKKTGYIHHSHVEPAAKENTSYKGVALKSSTPVYKEASTNGGAWKSYPAGSVLVYESFSENWYKATVYANGGWREGFIHHTDVENAIKDQKVLKGIGLKNPTTVYSDASTNSKSLKSYPDGSVLTYQTFTGDWYEATVYVGGVRKTGYIHSSHVEELLPGKQETLDGRALKKPTKVYSRASRGSSILKSYSQGSILKFRTFSRNWYEATVYLHGDRFTGYINVNDITTEDITNVTTYNYSFDYMVDRQMKYGGPKSDGAGNIPATRKEVAYYANPANFQEGTASYYQFLDLTQPAGLNAEEVNQNILKNKGSLDGTGQAFIDAGKKYNINEAYLIAHTLHETGNGTSTLAAGVPVDANGNIVSNRKNAAHIVYNMYGYGAKDSCPLSCGAKYAFDHNWFSPSAAILGGAGKVAQNYINRGQDTLYKMKWNPDNPATHQYATHVQWAVSQTKRIDGIYDSLNSFTLVYDVPKFVDQPGQAEKPKPNTGSNGSGSGSGSGSGNETTSTDYPDNVYGITNTGSDNLNLRDNPNGNRIGGIPNGSKIEVIGFNGDWLKVVYNGKTGWVHGDFVDFINLLEVTATNLNVRQSPNGDTLGQVSKTLLAAVLDKKNNISRNDEWYQVYYKGKKAWVSGGKNGTEYITVK